MKNYYVYEWIRLDTNEPFYIGKGVGSRWRKLTREGNLHFNRIVNKFDCVVNILHDNLTEQEAFDLEVWYIREYRDIIGYDLVNITDGGEGGKISFGKDNYFYGKHFYGSLNPNYGKKHSEEVRKKISEGVKKAYRTTDYEPWNKGKKRTDIVGDKHPLYGKGHTEESKKRISDSKKLKTNSLSKKVVCITTGKEFNSKKLAAVYYNIDDSGLNKHLKRRENPDYKGHCGKLKDGTKLYWNYL